MIDWICEKRGPRLPGSASMAKNSAAEMPCLFLTGR